MESRRVFCVTQFGMDEKLGQTKKREGFHVGIPKSCWKILEKTSSKQVPKQETYIHTLKKKHGNPSENTKRSHPKIWFWESELGNSEVSRPLTSSTGVGRMHFWRPYFWRQRLVVDHSIPMVLWDFQWTVRFFQISCITCYFPEVWLDGTFFLFFCVFVSVFLKFKGCKWKNITNRTSKSLRVKRGEKLLDAAIAAIRIPEFTNLTGRCLSFFRHQELFSTGSGKQGTTISNLVPENFVQVKYCWWLKSCGFLLFAISFAITPCFCFGSQVKTPDLLIGWVEFPSSGRRWISGDQLFS